MLAAQNGHAACLQRLLDAGAAVNQQQAEGSAALHYATRHGQAACLAALLQARRVDVNIARADGLTSCMIASYEGQQARYLVITPRLTSCMIASYEGQQEC